MSGWRATLLVAKREARERARSKAFLASTAITFALLGGIIAIVAITDTGPPRHDIALVGNSPAALAESVEGAAGAFGALVDLRPWLHQPAAIDALGVGEVQAVIVDDDTILLAESAPGSLETILEIGLRQARFIDALETSGIDPEAIQDMLGRGEGITVVRSGSEPDPTGVGIATAVVILLFVVITTYGQWVLMGVLEEKTNRVVELIVSSTSVRSLLGGKVLGIGFLAISQLVAIMTAALVAGAVFDLFEIPTGTPATVAWSLLWFVLGFAFYASLNAAAGSLVSRSEDAQSAATPVILLAVVSYLVSLAIVLPNPDTILATTLSLLPPMAPVAYPARIAVGAVPLWELVIGPAVMLAAIVFVVRVAARIYAGALLASGGRVRIREAWRSAGELVATRR